MNSDSTILITGASGFLGSWLTSEALAIGHRIIGIDVLPCRNPEHFAAYYQNSCENLDYESVFSEHRISTVFHLAGAASVPLSLERPVSDFMSLLPGTVSLVSYLSRFKPDVAFVMFSSAAVYGNPEVLPVLESTPVRPISPYGIHKATAEFIVDQYSRQYGLNAKILRIFSAYGAELRKQVVWDLCNKAIMAIRSNSTELMLHGTGYETRDFIHASDIAKAALLISDQPKKSPVDVFNVGSGNETSIRLLATTICNAIGKDLNLVFSGSTRPGDPVNWRADITKLKNINFVQKTSLMDGISKCVRWHLSITEK